MTTPTLREELEHLIQGYINLLETGRDRIIQHGGQCDSVEVMSAQDPYLIRAHAALAAQPELPEPTFVYKTITSGGNAGLSGYFDNVSGSVLRDGTELYTTAQLQQAVEQKEKATDEWRRLALQFDGHRMQALGWLKAILKELPDDAWPFARTFVSAPPLSGEQVLADRIAAQAKREPMSRAMALGMGLTHHGYTEDDWLEQIVRNVEAHHGIGGKA